MATQDATLVQHRGRWLAPRVMLTYLQELASTTFLSQLSGPVRERLQYYADYAPHLCEATWQWYRSSPTADAWPDDWFLKWPLNEAVQEPTACESHVLEFVPWQSGLPSAHGDERR